MTNEDLAVANARLRGQEHFLVGPAKFIGHYVVGRLSQDLGAGVQLAHSPVTGVTARLVLPSTIVSASREPLRAVPPASTTDSRQPVPAGPHHGEHDHEHEQDHEDVGVPAIPVGPPSMTGSNESGKPAEHPTGPAPVESYPAWPVPVASATGAGQRNGNGNSNGPHRAPDRQGGTAGFNGRDAAVGPDRTRNGLPKRRRGALASAPPPAVSSPPADAATIDRQPTDVRAMLSAFRAGTLRGESEATTSSTSMPNQETW